MYSWLCASTGQELCAKINTVRVPVLAAHISHLSRLTLTPIFLSLLCSLTPSLSLSSSHLTRLAPLTPPRLVPSLISYLHLREWRYKHLLRRDASGCAFPLLHPPTLPTKTRARALCSSLWCWQLRRVEPQSSPALLTCILEDQSQVMLSKFMGGARFATPLRSAFS